MTVAVLITGVLFRAPETKTSGGGKAYVRASVRAAAEGESSEFWTVLVFGDTARAELMRLHDGDKLSVQGKLKLDLYEKEGQSLIGRTIFADHVLALRAPPKAKKPKAIAAEPATPSILPPAGRAHGSDLDDDIPF